MDALSKRLWAGGIGLFIVLVAGATSARAQDSNQVFLAAQYDWGSAKGFFFVVESKPQGNSPASTRDAHLTLGVGDGHAWHFLTVGDGFDKGPAYRASAKIGNGMVSISVNGAVAGTANYGFTPAAGPLLFNQVSPEMRAPANYQVQEQALRVNTQGAWHNLHAEASGLPQQLQLLNPSAAGGAQAQIDTGNAMEIDATFRFQDKASLRTLSPFIDRYGQSMQADWPGKVNNDADLKTAQKIEAERFAQWPTNNQFDQYGGSNNAGWKENKTGFFYTAHHDGKWWLISPEGNPCFYIGLCNAPAYAWEDTPITGREYLFDWLPAANGPFAAARLSDAWHTGDGLQYVCFHTANMIREFGDNWHQRATESAVRRVHALAFSGFGKWSDGDLGVSDSPVLWNHGPNLVKHPDVFDPRVRAQMVEILRQEIEPRKNDPWLLGWSVGNEKDEDITPEEIRQILTMGQNIPARKALLAHAGGGTSVPRNDSQIEQLREYYEQTYWAFLYKTVKKLDPNHLYLGNWVTPDWWVNENDWGIAAANCDVLGFDWYAEKFHASPADHLIAQTAKPILCGEFSFPPTYDGKRGFGTYGTHVSTEAQAGQKYTEWLRDAATDPKCIGVFYFQYRDEPLTGRGPGNSRDTLVIGEDFAFGLVDETDRIKWDFAKQVRRANLGAVSIRNGAGQ